MFRILVTIVLTGLVTTSARAAEPKFTLTGDNTKVTFIGTKPDGKHEGGFKTVSGSITTDGKDPTTLQIAVDIDMNSTFTDDDRLTAHLKSPDFFGVKNNPKSKFVTTKIEKSEGGYNVSGKLTLCGKTKELTFPAKIEVSEDSLKLTSSFKINRTDWGMTFGKGKVDDDVSLSISVSAKK
jgi:polyisoprenoid-binding protein YceI